MAQTRTAEDPGVTHPSPHSPVKSALASLRHTASKSVSAMASRKSSRWELAICLVASVCVCVCVCVFVCVSLELSQTRPRRLLAPVEKK